jgi:hypothetical protein
MPLEGFRCISTLHLNREAREEVLAPTAFSWAHASWGNAKLSIPSDDQGGRRGSAKGCGLAARFSATSTLLSRTNIGAQPQARMGGLQSLPHYLYEVLA